MFSLKNIAKFALKKKGFIDENNNIEPEPPQKRRKTGNRISDFKAETIVSKKKEFKHKKAQGNWAYLPPEILAKIFGYVVESEQSALPCLQQFSKVCSHWRNVTHIPFLWTHLWFRPSLFKKEGILRKNKSCFDSFAKKFFSDVHTLFCTGLPSTSSCVLQTVACNAEKLRCVYLLRCDGKISFKNCLNDLMEKHKQYIEEFAVNDANISSFDLRKVVLELGDALHTLEIKNSALPRDVQAPFFHLKNLRVLKIESGERFQVGLLKNLHLLTVVHLTNMRLETKGCMEIEWHDLEEIDLSCRNLSYGKCELDNRMLIRMLKYSPKLEQICFRNRRCDVENFIDCLDQCRFIKYLDISHCYGSDLSSLLLLLTPSLEELYLDKYHDINNALCNSFSALYWQYIKTLSIRGTEAVASIVGFLLHNCLKKIEVLDLSGCRYLPRGCRRMWKAEDDWLLLYEKLETDNA